VTPRSGDPGITLEDDIKQEARRLGFVLAGVTTPDAPSHFATFGSWIDLGRHGHMGYLATERSRRCRANPLEILPECKSILVLALPYGKPAESARGHTQSEAAGSRARVAAYAWGRDYHDVIPALLRELVAFIERRAGRPVLNRCYTDTGPLLERDLAQRAGLGWIGKNTCLINPRMGSYFLLAEILLDLELRPDAALQTDHCGTCSRCITSCPTECILPDRTIDARRCISYLTIENRDAIPLELRSRVGSWIFGCDICQTVCPWNRFAPSQGEPALAGDASGGSLILAEQLRLSKVDFAKRARGTPLRRAKHSGFMRNAAVAAGNVSEADVKPLLEQLAHSGDPLIEENAVWALAQITNRNGGNG
jgi:epoxyqueuosine reductase